MRWMVWTAVVGMGCGVEDPRPHETETEEVGGPTTADLGAAGETEAVFEVTQAPGMQVRIVDGDEVYFEPIADPCTAFADGYTEVGGVRVELEGEVVEDRFATIEDSLVVICTDRTDLVLQFAVPGDFRFTAWGSGIRMVTGTAVDDDGNPYDLAWTSSEWYAVEVDAGQYDLFLTDSVPLAIEPYEPVTGT